MAFYEIEFTYKIEEYGAVELEAESEADAEVQARDYIRDSYPDAMLVTIDEVKPISDRRI